jgi:PhoH-like ATPase
MPKNKKIFILDTNVILHDSSCINCFDEHDIIIPIAVLEELDQFKKGSQIINDHARQFVRELDKISTDKLFNGGISLGDGKGKIALRLDMELHPDLMMTFAHIEKKDHRIINIGYHIAKSQTEHTVILVSKDVNLRMKARSVRLMAEDYTTDYVRDPAHLYSGCRYEENVESELIELLYGQKGEITGNRYTPVPKMFPNEYMVLRNGKKSVLATNTAGAVDGDFVIRRVTKETVYGISPRNAEQSFAVHALLNPNVKLVTISGKAGTGKTLLALAAGKPAPNTGRYC